MYLFAVQPNKVTLFIFQVKHVCNLQTSRCTQQAFTVTFVRLEQTEGTEMTLTLFAFFSARISIGNDRKGANSKRCENCVFLVNPSCECRLSESSVGEVGSTATKKNKSIQWLLWQMS